MITLDQYRALLTERPRKFTSAQVGFHAAKQGEPMCAACVHFYIGTAMEKDVCEIQRPKNEHVPWNWVCTFWTADGENYPLLKSEPAKEEGAEDDAH